MHCYIWPVLFWQPPVLQSKDAKTFPSVYTVRRPAPRLASIFQLEMVQDRPLEAKLQQAKLMIYIFELQAAGLKEHLGLAFAKWEKAAANLPLASPDISLSSPQSPLVSSSLSMSSSHLLLATSLLSSLTQSSMYLPLLYPVKLTSSLTYQLSPFSVDSEHARVCIDVWAHSDIWSSYNLHITVGYDTL